MRLNERTRKQIDAYCLEAERIKASAPIWKDSNPEMCNKLSELANKALEGYMGLVEQIGI